MLGDWKRPWLPRLIWNEIPTTVGECASPYPEPDCPAEVVFTTGSSGRPKGVLQTHRSILHCSWRMGRALGLQPDDRVALLATLNSGQGRGTLFRCLLWGARLCHWPVRERGVAGLAEWIEARRSSVHCALPTPGSAELQLVRLEAPACGTHPQRVQALVDHYVDWLRSYWSRLPWMQPFWVMERHLT